MRIAILVAVACLLSFGAQAGEKINDGNRTYVLKGDPLLVPAYLAGAYFPVVAHELGHAVTVLMLGGKIKHLKLYPHTERGVPILGGIHYKAASNFSVPIISIAGVGATVASAWFLAPLIPKAGQISYRHFLEFYMLNSVIQWPLYAVFDTFAHWGDMARISDFTGIPTWMIILPAFATSYFLTVRWLDFRSRTPNSGVVKEVRGASAAVSASPSLPVIFKLFGETIAKPFIVANPVEKLYGGGFRFHF